MTVVAEKPDMVAALHSLQYFGNGAGVHWEGRIEILPLEGYQGAVAERYMTRCMATSVASECPIWS
jgi:hypothetical protein